jgi:hypothetical protein
LISPDFVGSRYSTSSASISETGSSIFKRPIGCLRPDWNFDPLLILIVKLVNSVDVSEKVTQPTAVDYIIKRSENVSLTQSLVHNNITAKKWLRLLTISPTRSPTCL